MKDIFVPFTIFGLIGAATNGWALTIDGTGLLRTTFDAVNDTVFMLYTRRNPTSPQILRLDDEDSIDVSNFNSFDPIRLLVHGWNGDGNSEFNIMTRQAYMNRGSFNVIVVDWGDGAKTLSYMAARRRVDSVAMVIARFIDNLVGCCRVSTNRISMVGHGLGAHIAGMTGQYTTTGQLHTIFGLDPALLLFARDRPDERLSADDAQYVEAIVTSGGVVAFFEPLGYSTFYPNGGVHQPGCGLDIAGWCSHARAYQYFAESINSSSSFLAKKCRDFTNILVGVCTPSGPSKTMAGEPSNYGQEVEGVYWVNTNAESPFAQ